MQTNLQFLPEPRQVAAQGGRYSLPESALILLESAQPQALRSAAARIQTALAHVGGVSLEQTASAAVSPELVAVRLRVAPELSPEPQGYRLHITPRGVVIDGHDAAGVFYGACTLVQVVQQAGRSLPCLEVYDWPDIPARGVMLDISRDKVYSMETLYALVDRLASWKINQLQLYTEHTFAYHNHPEVWAQASPVTGEEILALDAYCRERFVELVPNQNSFGHMHRWLTHARYASLAEIQGPFMAPWGEMQMGPFSIAPENPASLALIQSLYDELLPHFSSRMVNAGMDETFDLGAGASKAAVEKRGEGPVYLDFLLKIYADVKRRGCTLQFWGDIIMKHPELVPLLPRDAIALSWGYEDTHPFDTEGATFAASGVPFYVCPGTSAWNTLAGRTSNALGNLLNAAENGLRHGAIGYLNTDWGDAGHWQSPPVSYLGFAAGAALSWAVAANRANDWQARVSRFAFDDPTGSMGQVAYDLGNVYKAVGFLIPNSSALFWVLADPMTRLPERLKAMGLEPEFIKHGMRAALDAIDSAMQPAANERMERPDADLIRREYANTARLMRHACRRARLALSEPDPAECAGLAQDMHEFLDEYRALWLARCRPGGLKDSTVRFESMIAEYLA